MRDTTRRIMISVVLSPSVMLLLTTSSAGEGQQSRWEFEEGFLSEAAIGADLGVAGSPTAVAGPGGSDTGAALLDNGDFFTATNPIGGNGGGVNTNEYTILMDIKTESAALNALLDMDGTSDADMFINGAGEIGIGTYGGGPVNDGVWHRLVFVFDLGSGGPGSEITAYVDGVFAHSPIADGLDGRWSLQSTFTVFSDNGGGKEHPTSVSNLWLYDTALTASEVAALGSPVPEPSTLALFGILGLVGGVARRHPRRLCVS